MSGEALGWARKIDCTGRDASGRQVCLPLAANAVLLLMADYAGRKLDLDPSIETMAEELGCTSRTIQRAIVSLISDGHIEREFRATEKGKTTSSRYLLRLRQNGPEGCKAVTPRGDTQSPLGVTHSHHEGDVQSPSTTFEPRTLSESADALSERAREIDPPIDEAFERVEAAWGAAAPTAVSPAEDLQAWQACEVPPDELEAAAMACLQFVAADGGRLVALRNWLGKRRFEPFLARLRAAKCAPAEPARPVFDGPADFVAAVRAEKRPEWIVSWLDPCRWDAEARAIVSPTGFAADTLRRDLRRLLIQFEIEVRK